MILIFAIAIGGAIGSVARYLLSKTVQNLFMQNFPWGILSVNILGCFFMGILTMLFLQKINIPHAWRSFFLVGILGGFTTFSGFTIDVVDMFSKGNTLEGWFYIAVSVVLCLFATGFGMYLGRLI